jgi:hypothetical protein
VNIAADDHGEVFVVWADDRSGDGDIYFRVFDGSDWKAEKCLVSAEGESHQPFACTGMAGKLHVVWSDWRDGNYEIYYKLRDPGGLAALEDGKPLPGVAGLIRICPNPVVKATNLRLAISRTSDVEISVFDTAGRLIWRKWCRGLSPGEHGFQWDARDLRHHPVAPGVYFVSVNTGTTKASAKMVVLR